MRGITRRWKQADGHQPRDQSSLLERLLAAQGLTLAGEPSESGVFRALAPRDADLAAAAERLMAAPQILFAAPEAQP